MTNQLITPLLPTDNDRAYDLLRDTAHAAALACADELRNPYRNWDPRNEIRDADDYIDSASLILRAIIVILSESTPDTDFCTAILELLTDDNTADAFLTADFGNDLSPMIDFPLD